MAYNTTTAKEPPQKSPKRPYKRALVVMFCVREVPDQHPTNDTKHHNLPVASVAVFLQVCCTNEQTCTTNIVSFIGLFCKRDV